MKQFLISLDQTANTLCGGWADETLSAHAWRSGWLLRSSFINWLARNPNHCQESYESECLRSQLPPSYRTP